MADDIRIHRLSGPALAARLGDVARLRTTVFRAFPYLYDGSSAYEERYLATYVADPESIVVAALAGDDMIGAATGLPLTGAPEAVIDPFRRHGFDIARVFYFGESVLLPEYRGRGVGVAFFAQREAHARSLGRFDTATFCAVERPADDPRRPPGHLPLDAFWRKRGYRPAPNLSCEFSWREIDESGESAKTMLFWIKELSA